MITLPQMVGGVKRKPQVNTTNYLFANHPSCMAEYIPSKASIKDKMPYVYKQTYGSCTANAVIACDHYYYHTNKHHPSATFTYHQARVIDGCGRSKHDDGSSVESALMAVRKYGVCVAEVWPNEKPFYNKPSKEAYKNGLKGQELTTFHRLRSLTQLKKAIAKGYPIPCALSWCFRSINGNTWILTAPTDEAIEDCEQGHAIVVVGYDDDTELVEIRNSWGSQWGNNGYAYIDYDTFKKIVWWDDTYAVVK
jgi:hypothetical protein